MRIFNEIQKFTQWWITLMNVALLGFIGYASYNWFFLKSAFGNLKADDHTGQIIAIILLLICVGFIYMIKLRTTIDEIGIHYQFIPMHFSKKTIRWSELKKCYVRTYNPISEYGGWGYRISLNQGKALNIKGDKGIQLEFKDSKKLLIGTQKQEEAQKVIERYFF